VPQRCLRRDHFVGDACNEARRPHFAFQVFRGEIGASRREAGIKRGHYTSPLIEAARPGSLRALRRVLRPPTKAGPRQNSAGCSDENSEACDLDLRSIARGRRSLQLQKLPVTIDGFI
jgi:hypothetical protein